jgi:uncharacterized protein (DUF427 family)
MWFNTRIGKVLNSPLGFSLSRWGHKPSSGYMVAMQGRTTVLDPSEVDRSVIDEHIEQNADVYCHPNTHIGGWYHGGKIYLEPAQNVRDFGEAYRLGEQRNQIAIWDVRNKRAIPGLAAKTRGPWSKRRRFDMAEPSRPIIPAAEERARLKEGVHIERSPRRIRTYFGGKLIADSERVLLVYETKRPPAYWFPIADVRTEYLKAKDQPQQPADTIRWHLVAEDRIAQSAARAYIRPTGDRAALDGYLTFYWDQMDAWFEEDEEVFVHPRDPYTRVDTVHSSRHVRVEIEGVTLCESHRPILLFETGLPTRYYIPKQNVRMDLLEPTDSITRCPYKGVARYWSARVRDKLVKDVVWSYPAPIPECPKIENLLSFYNEHVDLYVDGMLQERPITPFS